MKYRVSIEIEPSLVFVAEYEAATHGRAEERHIAELWRRFGRRREPEDCETVEIDPPDIEGVPS